MNPRRPWRQQAADDYRDDSRIALTRPLWTTVAWRWRYETGAALVLLLLFLVSWRHWQLGIGVALMLAAVQLIPEARHVALARLWCVVTAHRVRVGCAAALLVSHTGRLPAILRVSPVRYGERVEIWCPPGLAPDDFVNARSQLAAACWARDVRVTHRVDRSHRIVLEVIRRGHATTDEPLDSAAFPTRPAVVRLPDAVERREIEG